MRTARADGHNNRITVGVVVDVVRSVRVIEITVIRRARELCLDEPINFSTSLIS